MSVLLSLSPADATLLRGRRILVVEDEYFLANDIDLALRAYGADIAGPVGDIEDALRILDRGGLLDAAVLDVNIHEEMVFPIARELRARHVPFVFTSGYDKMVIAKEFESVTLWEKPIDVPGMVQELAGVLRRNDRP